VTSRPQMKPNSMWNLRSSIHMVGERPFKLKLGIEVHTRCGIVATPIESQPPLYTMTNANGGDFRCTTVRGSVTCLKCSNLLSSGTIHAFNHKK
jgi:hypothetical protein